MEVLGEVGQKKWHPGTERNEDLVAVPTGSPLAAPGPTTPGLVHYSIANFLGYPC